MKPSRWLLPFLLAFLLGCHSPSRWTVLGKINGNKTKTGLQAFPELKPTDTIRINYTGVANLPKRKPAHLRWNDSLLQQLVAANPYLMEYKGRWTRDTIRPIFKSPLPDSAVFLVFTVKKHHGYPSGHQVYGACYDRKSRELGELIKFNCPSSGCEWGCTEQSLFFFIGGEVWVQRDILKPTTVTMRHGCVISERLECHTERGAMPISWFCHR